MPHPAYLGIDLGTTNSSLAYATLPRQKVRVELLPIPQLVRPGTIEPRDSLPSFLYLPGQFDLPPAEYNLPGAGDRDLLIGEFARNQGRKVPIRLVHSAKSWLCHAGVDRNAAILPWGAPAEIAKMSPVEASAHYLRFLAASWEQQHRQKLAEQPLVLTVPASFDEVARELTMQAAHQAGLTGVVLLEEPIAAFYYWIYRYHARWPKAINDSMLALIVDIGGGTTDFSLLAIKRHNDQIEFDRIAVGNHLLLGGDNMDLALAFYLEKHQAGRQLDAAQFSQLVGWCSASKELLWRNSCQEESKTFSIAGSGASVVGGSLKFKLSRSMLQDVILDGFFPMIASDYRPDQSRRVGFQEWGLPYEAQPAITGHLWQFLRNHLLPGVRPELLLFNGGVLNAAPIRERLIAQISDWFAAADKKWRPKLLSNNRLDLAAALGAAYYNLVRHSGGTLIGTGAARSYFLQVGSAGDQPLQTICILPFGARQGLDFTVDQHPLAVMADQPVAFPLYSSTTKKQDELGDIVAVDEAMSKLAPVQTLLKVGKKSKKKQIPVQLQTRLSEIGTLEVCLLATDSQRQWRLQFSVRPSASGANGQEGWREEQCRQVSALLAKIFARDHWQSHPPQTLMRELEKILGQGRQRWDLAGNRKIFDLVLPHIDQRDLSAAHEERCLNLCGFCLRPGIGAPGDDWRCKRIMALLPTGIHYERNVQSWLQWWILWRRIAAGLNANQQLQVFRQAEPYLAAAASKKTRRHVKDTERGEMWCAAASLEALPLEKRFIMGENLAGIIEQCQPQDYHYWSLGRLGSRTPFHGHNVLAPEKIIAWINLLLTSTDPNPKRFYALAQLARKTGDRAIDIDEATRAKVLAKLQPMSANPQLAQLYLLVNEVTTLNSELQKHYFGDFLPTGLIWQ